MSPSLPSRCGFSHKFVFVLAYKPWWLAHSSTRCCPESECFTWFKGKDLEIRWTLDTTSVWGISSETSGEQKSVRERYILVAAIINTTIAGVWSMRFQAGFRSKKMSTAAGSCAMMARRNQMTPCVQSKCPKPSVPAPRRRRKRPTSMVKNKITSVESAIRMLYLQLSVLST